jgi:hypothetical protein
MFFIALATEPIFSWNLGLTKMIEMESGLIFPFIDLIIAMKNYLDYQFFLS